MVIVKSPCPTPTSFLISLLVLFIFFIFLFDCLSDHVQHAAYTQHVCIPPYTSLLCITDGHHFTRRFLMCPCQRVVFTLSHPSSLKARNRHNEEKVYLLCLSGFFLFFLLLLFLLEYNLFEMRRRRGPRVTNTTTKSHDPHRNAVESSTAPTPKKKFKEKSTFSTSIRLCYVIRKLRAEIVYSYRGVRSVSCPSSRLVKVSDWFARDCIHTHTPSRALSAELGLYKYNY